jgi:hypothetical protein
VWAGHVARMDESYDYGVLSEDPKEETDRDS